MKKLNSEIPSMFPFSNSEERKPSYDGRNRPPLHKFSSATLMGFTGNIEWRES